MISILAISAQDFAIEGRAWVEAIGGVANSAIAQFGIIAAAIIGLLQNITLRTQLKSTKDEIQSTKDEIGKRLDNQSLKIHEVALAQSPNGLPHEVTTPTKPQDSNPQPSNP